MLVYMNVVKDYTVLKTVTVLIIMIVVVAKLVTIIVILVTVLPKLNVTSVLQDSLPNQILMYIVWLLVQMDTGLIGKLENVHLVTTLVLLVTILEIMDIVILV
jgi:hypothetical protein